MSKLYPFGYAIPNAEQRLATLMDNEQALLVDIRYKPYSQRPEWQGEALRAKWGKRYRPIGGVWGNKNYNNDKPIELAAPYTGWKIVKSWLEAGHDLILLCACARYESCHRRVVVDYIREQMPTIEVVEEDAPIAHQRDIVVTVPLSFGLDQWVDEGQLPGEPDNGLEYHFYLSGAMPVIEHGERVYIVYKGTLRGYAPLVRIDRFEGGRYGLVRHGGAVAVTIPEYVQGFRGFRYRWWDRGLEIPFPDWQNPDAKPPASELDNALAIVEGVGRAIEPKAKPKVPIDYWTSDKMDFNAKERVRSALNAKY